MYKARARSVSSMLQAGATLQLEPGTSALRSEGGHTLGDGISANCTSGTQL